jgi:phosphatidylglycerophosphate synthase
VALALLADALTAARAVAGVALAVLVAQGRLAEASLVLAAAWLSDALDGRLARASRRRTRLGPWDMPIDVGVGAGLLVGLGSADAMPAWLAALVLLVLGGGYLALRQPALGMALQAVGYAGFLWRAFEAGVPTRWAPVAVAVAIWLTEWGKFWRVEVPAFLSGIAEAVRLRRGDSLGLPRGRRGRR